MSNDSVKQRRKPDWLKVKTPIGSSYSHVYEKLRKRGVHTICTSGKCPNIGECWGEGTATMMILGDVCTRACRFCATKSGVPGKLDPEEPRNIAKTAKELDIKHLVLTSVDRDDLDDLGAGHWAKTIREAKDAIPGVTIEALIPDFQGREDLVQQIIDTDIEVISHNLETVEWLTPKIRSRAKYRLSLEVINYIARSQARAKSGIMVGLGESDDDVFKTMDDLLENGCEVMTIGQYLQPTNKQLPVERYVTPGQFDYYRKIGLDKGFKHVESAPLVRSSYHAQNHLK